MAEIFIGTPAIVSVTVSDQEGRQVQYHVAGRDMDDVKDAVRAALAGLPDSEAPAKPARKPRRTKAEMAQVVPAELAPEWANGKPPKRAVAVATGDKTWP